MFDSLNRLAPGRLSADSKSQTASVLQENMAADTRGDAERSFRDRVPPLLTDLYHFTMAYAHWRAGRAQEPAVFELFFRENPFGGGFTLFAGLHDCLRFLRGFHFTEAGEEQTLAFRRSSAAPQLLTLLNSGLNSCAEFVVLRNSVACPPVEPRGTVTWVHDFATSGIIRDLLTC